MSNSLTRSLQLTETRYFIIGVVGAFLIFVLQLGWRWIVLFAGSTIVLVAFIYWLWLIRSTAKAESTSADLLQLNVFMAHLDCYKASVPAPQREQWQALQEQSLTIWTIAAQLAQRESFLIPDLLETLHFTLGLTEQAAQSLRLALQMQTPDFQNRANQQMKKNVELLQAIEQQLQILVDQVAWERLEQRSSSETPVLVSGLHRLIAENDRAYKSNQLD